MPTSERGRRPAVGAAAFPGATGLTVLDVYDWIAPDGLRGGSAHVHLASAEGYLVLSGAGSLQTLSQRGYAATPLRPGDCLWFTPGTIHRLINDGDLRLAVVMQNAGLPEHGDAVLTFPPEILADPARYARAASLDPVPADPAPADSVPGESVVPGPVPGESLADRARRRASLAVEGYLRLRDQVADRGPAALQEFYAAALALTAERVPDWRARWHGGALATAGLTRIHLDEIAAHDPGHLTAASTWRIPGGSAPDEAGGPDADTRAYGMCGRLTTYPPERATRVL